MHAKIPEDSKGSFGLWISIINRSAQSYFYHKLEPFGLGTGQQAYLLALLPGEEIVQDQLAQRLQIDRANVTRALGSLIKSGYVQRRISPEDRRARLVSLTEKGTEVRREVEGIASQWIETLQKAVSADEWNQSEQTLRKIALSLHE
ncbi:MarR family winged helix-turn-helix transcriptional regulator [Salinispira pacifica]|nr:MarR family winged helix-turn-helix transcriptional regulator [Salinispira pacifica]